MFHSESETHERSGNNFFIGLSSCRLRTGDNATGIVM
jgi:hypothetical protein